jgi:epsin
VELLSDVEKIRSERRKAKTNRTKYIGVGNDGMGFGGTSNFESGGGRYGGFAGDLNSSYNGSYGNGGLLVIC